MAMKYKKINMPINVWENFKKKQFEMQRVFQEITGKPKKIPFTKVLVAVSQKPLWLYHEELLKLPKKGVFKI